MYAVGHPGLSLRGRFRAAVLAGRRGTALAHFSAAADWGFIAWREREPEIIVTRGGARHIPGVKVYRSGTLVRRDVRYRDAIPVTSPARTLLDLAPVLPEKALRGAARQAQAMRLVTCGEIVEICDRLAGHRDAGKLRRVVADGPAPTASPLEDVVLDLLDGAGIPRPLINRPHDAEKQAILEARGYRVVRVTKDQAERRPGQTLARIRAALADTSQALGSQL